MQSLKNIVLINRIKRKYKMINKEKSDNRIFYIIRREDPNVGIFSCILTFLSHLRYADEKGYIPVIDMMNFNNEYLYPEEIGRKNAWEFYFLQPGNVALNIAYNGSKVKLSNGHFKKGYAPSENFLNSKSADDYAIWKELWEKYIHYNDDTLKYLDENFKKINNQCEGENIVGVLARGTDYFYYTKAQSCDHIYRKLKLVIDKVRKTADEKYCKWIFLATEDESILKMFIKAFGERLIFIEDDRLSLTEQKLLGEAWKEKQIDLKKKGLNYILNFYILSHCKCFVGARTSMSVFLPIVGNLEYMFFYDLVNIEKEMEFNEI